MVNLVDVSQYASAIDNTPCYKLSKHQKEAVGLLQIGTFLEYFDLMLYVHMSVVLNGLFFPKMDPKMEAITGALTFSSIYLLRPVGALIFGYIGDMIGRKTTIILTTGVMGVTCMVMATLPTYQDIGITATYVFFCCRILQGVSSMGEIVGSQIYAVELIQEPRRHLAVGAITWCTEVGGLAALIITTYVLNISGNWRNAFWIGSFIAVIGSMARTRLRETPEFIAHNKEWRNKLVSKNNSKIKNLLSELKGELPNKKNLAYIAVKQVFPVSFFVAYIFFNVHLKNVCGFAPEQLVTHNLKTCVVAVVFNFTVCLLTSYVPALKIFKAKTVLFIGLLFFALPAINSDLTHIQITVLQVLFITLGLDVLSANGVFIQNFPMAQRFSVVSITWALSRLTAHLIFISSLVYLNEIIGFNALIVVYVPLIAMAWWGLKYFEKLEKQKENMHSIFTPLLKDKSKC